MTKIVRFLTAGVLCVPFLSVVLNSWALIPDGAPVDAEYVVGEANDALTAETFPTAPNQVPNSSSSTQASWTESPKVSSLVLEPVSGVERTMELLNPTTVSHGSYVEAQFRPTMVMKGSALSVRPNGDPIDGPSAIAVYVTDAVVDNYGYLALGFERVRNPNFAMLVSRGIGTVATRPIAFGFEDGSVNFTEAMRILVNRNVGIGTASPNTTLHVNGGVSVGVASKSTPYTMTTSDCVILANAMNGALTVTLPSASKVGMLVHIKKMDSSANTVTISRTGTDTIEGAAAITLPFQYNSRTLVASGGGLWVVISSTGFYGEYPGKRQPQNAHHGYGWTSR